MRFSDLKSVASALTLVRFAVAIALPLLPAEWLLPGFLFALLTDVVDGPVARRTGRASPAGACLDAWADKVLHVNLAWHMAVIGKIPAWWMLLWFSREIVQAPMIPFLLRSYRSLHSAPETRVLGRLTAISLAVAVALSLLDHPATMLNSFVGILGVCAGVDYGRAHLPPVLRRAFSNA